MALLDYDDLKAVLSLEGTAASSYPGLEYLMTSTEEALAAYCHRSFLFSSNEQETFSIGRRTHQLPLRHLPLATVASVTVDGTSLAATGYRLFPTWGIHCYAPLSSCEVTVVYSGGYTKATAPKDLVKALVLQTAYEFQTLDYLGASTIRNEGGMVTRPELGLLEEVKRLLTPYRALAFP